jgi:Fe-S cluster assembly protein SufD
MASPRNLIVTGDNSKVSIVESYVARSQDVYFTNAVTEMLVGENAVIEHDKLQLESGRAFHIATAQIHQRARSTFTSNAISLGGSLVRNNVTVVLGAEGIESTLNGLSLATGTQHIDNHTTIEHAQPQCASHELYKAILDGEAKGVFNGKIFVRKDAQKTDAKQTNKTLLLSDGATIDTKPQLEIFADDVKCTHGATVGQLDEEQIFYLRSRGIGLDAARDLLTFAFASDVINRVHVEPLRAQLDRVIHARLRAGRLTQG